MRISWSPLAVEDVRGISDWLEQDATPATALRIVGATRHRARFLEDFPRGGRPHSDGQRILRVFDTPYLIRYRIKNDTVEVIRVHHDREDWQLEP
ncbi:MULTISPECIES: type II toxin-antitoxin system RelE/ParE family toxin [Sphingomonas]|jgi:toxin ParE1/3/4|uniref:type II toxin-antitoxin system RelE/ParE family toxin n=1 Tax=Sphingomonas TaxID=13687 RepID=UPI001AEE3169|nr:MULTISPECIES: type II toxin-antitoxin system RelE/ParE family toxin [Sphingomonas]